MQRKPRGVKTMNADEIRNKRERFSERISGSMACEPNEKDMSRYQGDMIRETAAQLAEINEHLAKIANPLMVVNGTSPWVWLKYHDKSFVIDKGEVAFVCAPNDHQCLIYRRNEGGEDAGSWCDGTLKEICTKLGIPLEGK